MIVEEWKYNTIHISVDSCFSVVDEELDKQGADGWELVSVQRDEDYWICFMKRPTFTNTEGHLQW